MSRYERKNLQDLFADKGTDSVTMVLANFHDVDDNETSVDRAVVAFVDDEKKMSFTGAVVLGGEDTKALKEHCRSAWADGKPLVTLTKGEEGKLPVLTAELPAAGEGTESPKEEAPSA